MHLKFLFFIFSAWFIFLPNAVFAHAIPVTYEPDSSKSVVSMPSQVSVRFSERLEPSASSIRVFAPDGTRVDTSSATVDANDAHILSAPIKDAGAGGYAVAWQVVSADDGHFSKGAFSFSFGRGGMNAAAPTVDVVHNSGYAEASAIWLELLGESIFLSAFILFMFLLRPLHRRLGMALGKEYPFFEKRFALIVSLSLFLVCAGSLMFFTLKSAELSNLQNISFKDGAVLFSHTISGEFALIRIFLSLALLALFLARWKSMVIWLVSEKITREEIIFFISALILAALRARLSHAAADPFHPHFSIFVNFLHMMGKGFLVGAPMVVATAFAPALKRCGLPRSTAEIVSGFSRLAAGALALAGVTGVYIIWLHLKGFGNLLTTEWGARLLYLLGAFFLLFAFRMYHHCFADKDARDFVQTGNGGKDCHRHFYFAEAIAGAFVSFFSALIIITTPPLTTGPFALAGEGNGATVTLSEYQDKNMMMDGMDMGQEKNFLLSVKNKDATLVHVKNFAVTLTNEKLGIGPILVEGHAMSDTFMFPENALSPPGVWSISVQAERENAYDAVTQFHLTYPDDIIDPKNARTFGTFEMSLTLSALGIILFSFFLLRRRY